MSQKTRIVVPKVQARMFRLHQDDAAVNSEDQPQQVIFRELEKLKAANDDGRIKGVEHESTALFGGVAQLNIGEDPTHEIFEEALSNDHLEIFYRDIGDPTEKNKMSIKGVLTSFGRHEATFARKPQFFGPVWKADNAGKPSSVNTQLNAWDYQRIMQYYNIPRGKGDSSSAKFIEMKEVEKKDVVTGIKARPSSTNVRMHSDLLDYMDHAIELYLGEMYNADHSTVMTPMEFIDEPDDDLKLTMEHKDLKLSLYTIAANSDFGGGPIRGIPDIAITNDYPKFTGIEINQITNVDDAWKIDETIEEAVNDKDSIGIFRFMDAQLKIANGVKNNRATSKTFRVVGEIVAIDQFGLAKLLTGAITYDHGLHHWYTPIVDFNEDYVTRMREMLGILREDETVAETDKSVGKLVYVRFRAGEITGDRNEVTRQDLHRIAVFNRDSFGSFMEFFSNTPDMNFHTIGKYISQGMGTEHPHKLMRDPAFLSLAVSIVDFPQGRYLTPYTVFINTKGDRVGDITNTFALILEGAAIDENTPEMEIYKKLRIAYLKRSSSYSALIATAFKKDDKFISFMTNIPASYMRADIFTGSKFKTISYDSLSIIRIIQILSSTMGGFPATNNPVQVGGGVGKFKTGGGDVFQNKASKVDSYPIFLANRVIIEPTIIFAQHTKNADGSINLLKYEGYQSISRAMDKTKDGNILSGYFFLRLEVAIRDQVIDKEKVDFEIPIGEINDLSIVKGAALNHVFRLSFAENTEFLKNLSNIDNTKKLLEDKNGISLTYRLGGQTGSASYGAIPPELNILTLQDMVQDDLYDPLYNRAQVNRNVEPLANNTIELPVHDPRLGWAHHREDPLLVNTGLVVMDKTTRSNSLVPKTDILADNAAGLKLSSEARLIGIKNFVDISDLKREIKTLRKLASGENIAFFELSSSRSDKRLFELIKIAMPFEFDFEDDTKFFGLKANTEVQSQSLKELLDSLAPLEDIEEIDMVWSFPLSGYHIVNYNQEDLTLRNMNIGLTDLQNDNGLFQDYMDSYAGIIALDLLVKGIRYLLWTLSKSRFLGHVYLPADYIKYTKGWKSDLKKLLPTVTKDTEANIKIVKVGSSIIFHVEDGNLTKRSVSIGGGLQGAVNAFLRKFSINVPDATQVNFAKKVISGTQAHKLITLGTEGKDTALIWYVSKKIVYIGKDSGYMMRLNMTEGSFDWTVFYREDTIITRLSEYYLTHGMGNFMVSKGGI